MMTRSSWMSTAGWQLSEILRSAAIFDVQADQAGLRERQEELEDRLLAAPAATRAEAAASARYLIQLFAATPEAQDPRRQKLIARALDDLARFTVLNRRHRIHRNAVEAMAWKPH